MRVQKLVPETIIATCPECDKRKPLAAEPKRGDFWPYCEDCGVGMNVFVRGRIEDDKADPRHSGSR
jgi:hypothetical protein